MFESISKLRFIFGVAAPVPTVLNVEPIKEKTPPSIFDNPNLDNDVNSEWKLCGWTLAQIIQATLCGEARGEIASDPDAANVVYVTIRNRMLYATSVDSFNVKRGSIFPYGSATPPIANMIFQKYAYSIWNDDSIFANCDSFSSKMRDLLCTNVPTANYNKGISRLIMAGMTLQEASKTKHYLNPSSATSKEPWVVSATASKKRHPKECKSGKVWKDTLTGRNGIKFTATLVCIGKHVFVSGVP